MIRLRFASARQARLRSATARQARLRSATVRQARVRFAAAWQTRLRVAAAWTVALVMIGGSSSVFACPVCFAAEETSVINGTRVGILVLLVITLVVQGAFIGFFLYLRNRAKRMADIELDVEWSELQRASR